MIFKAGEILANGLTAMGGLRISRPQEVSLFLPAISILQAVHFLAHAALLIVASSVCINVVIQVATFIVASKAETTASLCLLRLCERVFLLLWHITDIAHGEDTQIGRYIVDGDVDTTIQVFKLKHSIDHVIKVAPIWTSRLLGNNSFCESNL